MKRRVESVPGLIAPRQPVTNSASVPTLDDIKIGMSKEETARIGAHIADLLR